MEKRGDSLLGKENATPQAQHEIAPGQFAAHRAWVDGRGGMSGRATVVGRGDVSGLMMTTRRSNRFATCAIDGVDNVGSIGA